MQVSRAKNINKEHRVQMKLLDKAADYAASFVGSWLFIAMFLLTMNSWFFFNGNEYFHHFDIYPYPLFNLILAIFSVVSAALIMMSQSRQAQKDHLAMEHAYELEVKTEQEMQLLFAEIEGMRRQQANLIKDARQQQVALSDELADKMDVVILAINSIEEKLMHKQSAEEKP